MANTKMHIVISSYDDLDNPYYAGGGAMAVHEIAKRLTADYRVSVLTGRFPGAKDEVTRNGVKYIRIGSSTIGAKLGQMAFSAVLPYYAKRLKYDIWMESFTPPFSTSPLPLITSKPVIGLVHMLSAEDMERKYHLPFHLVENFGLKMYRNFVVPNPSVQKKIHKLHPKANIALIPNGVELPEEQQTNGTAKHIYYIGRMEINQKGLDLLLKAYAMAKNSISLPLYIAGSGERHEVDEVKKLIKKLNIADRVKLVGRVSGERKDELYRNSAFVVCPSRFETFSMIALEAMSYKKAFVCFDIEGLSWIPAAHKVALPKFNTKALAKTLKDLCADQKKAEQIGARSYSFVKEYEWESSARKYKDFILEVVNSHRAGVPALQRNV